MLLVCGRCREYRPREELKEGEDGVWVCKVKCQRKG